MRAPRTALSASKAGSTAGMVGIVALAIAAELPTPHVLTLDATRRVLLPARCRASVRRGA
jgi:hypothetical protein